MCACVMPRVCLMMRARVMVHACVCDGARAFVYDFARSYVIARTRVMVRA